MRREYQRLLIAFAFRYFPPETRLGELDRKALQGFVTCSPPIVASEGGYLTARSQMSSSPCGCASPMLRGKGF